MNKSQEIVFPSYIHYPGCSQRVNPGQIHGILKKLSKNGNVFKDIGVQKLDGKFSVVQTASMFAPVIDDPFIFGQIVAASSLNGLYSSGVKPLTALNIVAFPSKQLDKKILVEILKGGCDKLKEAGVVLLGGHSINDPFIKCGYSISGIVQSKCLVTNSKAKIGDKLILTKPIGTGILLAQLKGKGSSLLSRKKTKDVLDSITALNKDAAEIMVEMGANGCTEVAGLGLLGHVHELARESKVSIKINTHDIPFYCGVIEYAQKGCLPGSVAVNKDYFAGKTNVQKGVSEAVFNVLCDAQVSGGLLIFANSKSSRKIIALLKNRGNNYVSIIGEVTEKSKKMVTLS
jgi:selenide, water dikinase